MSSSLEMERSSRFPVDHLLIASVILLIGLGLVYLYSASWVPSERISRISGREYSFIYLQVLYALIALPVFLFATWINLDFFRRRGVILVMLVLTAVFCMLPLVERFGGNKNGASRWINLSLRLSDSANISFQPSELVKVVLPLYLAHYFDWKKDLIDHFSRGILPPVLVTMIFFGLIILQNNFSTAMFIVVNALFIFFLAGVRIRFFIGALVIVLPLGALMILIAPHRVSRIANWSQWILERRWDTLAGGYQPRNSLAAIRAGGFWGRGIGQGTGKLTSIPEVQSDFIFSAYAEETGFLGVLILFALFAFFALRSYRAAMGQEETYRRLLAFGLASLILSQALINVAVAVAALPTTGIPLPFFSSGGSSLMITLIMAGLLINLSRTASVSKKGEL
ncbi:cell division protein FtsW [Spirochaetia bacterium]|nr:cell division protein FtsW [Spirochaetia bacterium]